MERNIKTETFVIAADCDHVADLKLDLRMRIDLTAVEVCAVGGAEVCQIHIAVIELELAVNVADALCSLRIYELALCGVASEDCSVFKCEAS